MLIVAIHDVAPAELAEIRWLLDRLDALGVPRRVLKVIPAAPGAGDDGELVALLRREVERGSEIVLHGWSHRAAAPVRGSLTDRLRAHLFARDGAEFLSLDATEVTRRVEAGRRWLEDHHLPAGGFCPPGWLATADLLPAVRDAGFDYLLTLGGLQRLDGGGRLPLPPTGYMGAGPIQELLVRIGGALVSTPLRAVLRAPARRVFLHPRNARASADCARVLAGIGRLAATHRSITYADLL